MPDNSYPYDVKFNIADGNDIGFMLVSPQGESKQIEIKEAGQPEVERNSNRDAASHQDFSPMLDTVYAMQDFSGGAGQLYYEEGSDNAYLWGVGISHVPGKFYLPPPTISYATASVTGNYTNFRTYIHSNGVRYDFMWEGVNLWRRNTSSEANQFEIVYTAANPITNFEYMDSVGLIMTPALSGTTDYFYQTDLTAAATWTPTVRTTTAFADGNKPSYMVVNRGTCYALVNSNLVYYTTDPTIDAWVGPIDVGTSGNIAGKPGDESYLMKHGIDVNDFLFTVRDDAVYSIDSQQDVEAVIWEWKDKPSINNFRHISKAGNKFLFNIRTEVRYYDPNTGLNREIGLNIRSGFSVKEVLGLAGDERYIYILAKVRIPYVRSADSVALIRAYPSVDYEYAFEILWEDTDVSATSYYGLFASPQDYDVRLYWGKNPDSGDSSLNSMLLPASWDSTAASTFSTTGELITSVDRSGFPGFDKRHLYLNTVGKGVTATYNIGVQYSTDNVVTFDSLSTMSSDEYSVSYDNEYSKNIALKFTLNGDGSGTPTLTGFDHHQRVRFKYLQAMSMAVRIGDLEKGVELRNSQRKHLGPDEWVDLLNQLRTTAQKVLYTDFMGNSFNVSIDMIFYKPTRHEAPGRYELEAVIICTRSDKGD